MPPHDVGGNIKPDESPLWLRVVTGFLLLVILIFFFFMPVVPCKFEWLVVASLTFHDHVPTANAFIWVSKNRAGKARALPTTPVKRDARPWVWFESVMKYRVVPIAPFQQNSTS